MQNKSKYIAREGWLSIFINIALFVLKFWAGTVIGSVAFIADAWHTLSDSVSSVIVLIGGKISEKPADKNHPFGHGRAEHIAAMIIGILLAIVAFDFILQSAHKFNSHEETTFGLIAWIVTITSIISKELLAQYALWGYRKTKSAVLKADGWHHRSDALSSIVILIGIAIGKYFWWTDAIMGIIVAIFIGWTSYKILAKEITSLLGESPSDELIDAIHKTVQNKCNLQVNLHHIHIHRYGNHTEMSCHIKLPEDMTLKETHEICSRIENLLMEKFGFVATIHPEPVKEKDN
jgi:cation diffusion facilitator family transporter